MVLAALGVVAFGSVAMAGKTGGTRSVASAKESSQAAAAVSADGTGNLSKLRRDELVKKIAEVRRFLAKSSDTNAVRLAASRRPFGDGSTRPRGQGFALSSTTTEIFG